MTETTEHQPGATGEEPALGGTPGYEPGAPLWVDLTTTDPQAAMAFYQALFGWELDQGGVESGGYTMCRAEGRTVAGINGQPGPPGFPPAWVTYLTAGDVDATAERVASEGGQVLMGPMDVMDQGRMMLISDPLGAVVGFWEVRAHRGAERFGEPGALCWNELATTDLDAAQAFYAAVCGHTFEALDTGEGGPPYRTFAVGGRVVGGMLQMDGYPDGVPPHWMPYFAVADVDDAARRAGELGATVHIEPTDSEHGRWSMITDPHGAGLTLVTLPEGSGQ